MQLYVDPGLRACGAAVFDGSTLVAAGLPEGEPEASMRAPADRARIFVAMAAGVRRWAAAYPLERLVVELPQIYPRGHQLAPKQGTDPNDLLHLAGVVGALAAAFATLETTMLLPAEWKGQLPKKIMHARALGAAGRPGVLSAAELQRIPRLPKSKLHNVMDAVSMGLVDAGRLASVHRY